MSITAERLLAAILLLLTFSAISYSPCERADGTLAESCKP